MTDWPFVCGTRLIANAFLEAGLHVWLYRFDYNYTWQRPCYNSWSSGNANIVPAADEMVLHVITSTSVVERELGPKTTGLTRCSNSPGQMATVTGTETFDTDTLRNAATLKSETLGNSGNGSSAGDSQNAGCLKDHATLIEDERHDSESRAHYSALNLDADPPNRSDLGVPGVCRGRRGLGGSFSSGVTRWDNHIAYISNVSPILVNNILYATEGSLPSRLCHKTVSCTRGPLFKNVSVYSAAYKTQHVSTFAHFSQLDLDTRRGSNTDCSILSYSFSTSIVYNNTQPVFLMQAAGSNISLMSATRIHIHPHSPPNPTPLSSSSPPGPEEGISPPVVVVPPVVGAGRAGLGGIPAVVAPSLPQALMLSPHPRSSLPPLSWGRFTQSGGVPILVRAFMYPPNILPAAVCCHTLGLKPFF